MVKKRVENVQDVENRYCTFIVMTRNAKMAVEGTFEPCKKGTNNPAVQRSLNIWSNFSTLNMPTFRISQCKIRLFIKKASLRR